MKLFRKAVIVAAGAILWAGFAQGAKTGHELAVEAWKKKDYKEFRKHASNFLINYPRHDYRSNIDYRIGKALAYMDKHKEAIDHLYKVAEKYRHSPNALMARDDARLIESAYELQPEALKAYFKADELKIHVSAKLKAKEHENLKAAFEKVRDIKGVSGMLASRIDYEIALVQTRDLKRDYTYYYPKIKPEMLIGHWETFEAEHEGEPIAFKGLIQRLRLYAWLAEPFGRTDKMKPRISFFDRAIVIARSHIETEKDENWRLLLRYRLAKLLKEKQFALYVIDVTRSFDVLRDTMKVYDELLAEGGDWYFVMDIISDMVDLKCLVNQFEDANKFALEHEKPYRGEPEYGQVLWTLFKYMSQAKDKGTLTDAAKILHALRIRYGSTTFYLNAIEQFRGVHSDWEALGVYLDEIVGGGAKKARKGPRAVVPEAGAPEKKDKRFLFTDSTGIFIGAGLGVVVLLTVLLLVAERLRYKEELSKAEQDIEDGRL